MTTLQTISHESNELLLAMFLFGIRSDDIVSRHTACKLLIDIESYYPGFNHINLIFYFILKIVSNDRSSKHSRFKLIDLSVLIKFVEFSVLNMFLILF